MTEFPTDLKHDALTQLDATLAAMRRLAEQATLLAHGLEQAVQTLNHNGDALWQAAPEATSAMAWQIAQANAVRALLCAGELAPASKGKAMPTQSEEEKEPCATT